ncbi:predicted protein [Nematostella vectensis]|uniref:Endonuclease/exonuclease/phosphatase domain-containing protein n=1 Tax=Nematostella vectensis TaxID=45351 RepID=A7RX17_NEMVE|nr:predicted protein [Nematostella vectensis]|eukprot:XP_001635953.1 predicted protein [Nematostella vectensis]
MIRQSKADVIGFQEVRSDLSDKKNQIRELQSLLGPEYKYSSYHPVTTVTPPLGAQGPPGWEQEGLGFISKHPIMLSSNMELKISQLNPDKNKRVLLHTRLNIQGVELDLTLVHFSYDKQQQCQNAVDLISHLVALHSKRSVVLGDFNVYADFPWPMAAIESGRFPKRSACGPGSYLKAGRTYAYVDVWNAVNHGREGYTFSNMPTPGLVSRPDRILVSRNGLAVIKADTIGGHYMSAYYHALNKWHRLVTVLHHTNLSTSTSITYTCHQDCGPHGSCRCGVCVRGGNKNNCDLQFCYECDDTFETVNSILAEEEFPSDHLMLTTLLELR